MKIDDFATDESVLKELGQRIGNLRLSRNLTQAQIAQEAGVTRPTIARVESGLPTDFSSIIRIFRALKLMDKLDALIAEQSVSPVELANFKGKTRMRARNKPQPKREWAWGDE